MLRVFRFRVNGAAWRNRKGEEGGQWLVASEKRDC